MRRVAGLIPPRITLVRRWMPVPLGAQPLSVSDPAVGRHRFIVKERPFRQRAWTVVPPRPYLPPGPVMLSPRRRLLYRTGFVRQYGWGPPVLRASPPPTPVMLSPRRRLLYRGNYTAVIRWMPVQPGNYGPNPVWIPGHAIPRRRLLYRTGFVRRYDWNYIPVQVGPFPPPPSGGVGGSWSASFNRRMIRIRQKPIGRGGNA